MFIFYQTLQLGIFEGQISNMMTFSNSSLKIPSSFAKLLPKHPNKKCLVTRLRILLFHETLKIENLKSANYSNNFPSSSLIVSK